MADNTTFSAGTADGDTYGSDDIAGVKFARIKLIQGADGTNDGDVSSANPLPVTITDGTDKALVTAGGLLQVDASGAAVPVTDNGGALTVDNGGTFAVQMDGAALTSLQLIDDVVYAEDTASANADKGVMVLARQTATPANTAGTDGDYEALQVSAGRLWTSAKVDTALPAGTNAIGKLAANSGVDIGDVDVTSVVPGTAATNLGKAEDDAHTSGDVGVMALSVRKDTAAATAGTDGDYQPLITDNTGRLHTINHHGRTLKTVSGSLTSDTDVITAVASKRLKVYAYSLITTDNTGDTWIFKSNGTAGTELWRVYLKGPDANTPFGANLAVTPPAFLFATAAGEKLTADVSSAATVHYSIAYWDDDAS